MDRRIESAQRQVKASAVATGVPLAGGLVVGAAAAVVVVPDDPLEVWGTKVGEPC
jgi:hypothetical protein